MKRKATYWYNRNIGLKGCVTVMGRPDGTREGNQIGVQMNKLSRLIWGLGAAADSIYNAQGFLVKFQSQIHENNERRAKLLTKVWRWAVKQGYDLRYLPVTRAPRINSEDFEVITGWINSYYENLPLNKETVKKLK